ncbi:hypothetical protein BH11ARM2_BH11ARM2_17520 [soil metagenome]
MRPIFWIPIFILTFTLLDTGRISAIGVCGGSFFPCSMGIFHLVWLDAFLTGLLACWVALKPPPFLIGWGVVALAMAVVQSLHMAFAFGTHVLQPGEPPLRVDGLVVTSIVSRTIEAGFAYAVWWIGERRFKGVGKREQGWRPSRGGKLDI